MADVTESKKAWTSPTLQSIAMNSTAGGDPVGPESNNTRQFNNPTHPQGS